MSRWPELRVLKALGLEMQRVNATTVQFVQALYSELAALLFLI